MKDQGEIVWPEWCDECRADHLPDQHVRDLRALVVESQERTAAAIRQVDDHAAFDWKVAADDAIRYVASRTSEFTADDIWWRLEALETPSPREPRALGARLQAAAKSGICVNSHRVVKSKRPETHGSWVAAWESRLYGERSA